MNESRRIVSSFSSTVVVAVVEEPGRVFEALVLSFCASRLRRCCVVVVAVLFVAEQNVRTVVVTSACLLACSVSLCLCLSLLPVVVVVLQQLPFPVWRSVLLLFLLFRIAPGVLPFPCNSFRCAGGMLLNSTSSSLSYL